MYMHMCLYIHTHIYIYIYTFSSIHPASHPTIQPSSIHLPIYLYIIFNCKHIFTHIYIYIHNYIYIYIYIYISLYIYINLYIYIYIHMYILPTAILATSRPCCKTWLPWSSPRCVCAGRRRCFWRRWRWTPRRCSISRTSWDACDGLGLGVDGLGKCLGNGI